MHSTFSAVLCLASSIFRIKPFSRMSTHVALLYDSSAATGNSGMPAHVVGEQVAAMHCHFVQTAADTVCCRLEIFCAM